MTHEHRSPSTRRVPAAYGEGMSEDAQLQRIREKLQLARDYPRRSRIEGADVHGFELGATVYRSSIESFEQRIGVPLPHEYRRFLTTVGNGGAFPSGRLAELPDVSVDGPVIALDPAVPLDDALIAHLRAECTATPDDDEYGTGDADATNDGILPIADNGFRWSGGNYIGLVLNGPFVGRLVACHPAGLRQPVFLWESNFLDQYERWLDEILADDHARLGGEHLRTTGWFRPRGTQEQLLAGFLGATDEGRAEAHLLALRDLDELSATTLAELTVALYGGSPHATSLLGTMVQHDKRRAAPVLVDWLPEDLPAVCSALSGCPANYIDEFADLIVEQLLDTDFATAAAGTRAVVAAEFALKDSSASLARRLEHFARHRNDVTRLDVIRLLRRVYRPKDFIGVVATSFEDRNPEHLVALLDVLSDLVWRDITREPDMLPLYVDAAKLHARRLRWPLTPTDQAMSEGFTRILAPFDLTPAAAIELSDADVDARVGERA